VFFEKETFLTIRLSWFLMNGSSPQSQPSSERGGFGVMDSLNASSEALVSPTTIHKWDSPKRTEKKSLPPTPKGKVKTGPVGTELNGKAVTTPTKDISCAQTAESIESTKSAVSATNSTPQPRAPSERKQRKSSSYNDDFDPMDCGKNDGEWHNQWWMCGFGDTIRDFLMVNEPGKRTNSRRSRRSKSPEATETSNAKRGEC
jgi:hypothetical protein